MMMGFLHHTTVVTVVRSGLGSLFQIACYSFNQSVENWSCLGADFDSFPKAHSLQGKKIGSFLVFYRFCSQKD